MLSIFKKIAPSIIFNNARQIFTRTLKLIDDGTFIVGISNDGRLDENKEQYELRSLDEFKRCLKPNTLHIYVDKAKIDSKKINFVPGHISSFSTDEDNKVLEDSFVSLRGGQHRLGDLFYNLPVDVEMAVRKTTVWDIEFYNFEKEFRKHLFKFVPNTDSFKDRVRFLIGIPHSLIIKNTGYTQEDFLRLAKEAKSNTFYAVAQ